MITLRDVTLRRGTKVVLDRASATRVRREPEQEPLPHQEPGRGDRGGAKPGNDS